MIISMTGFGSGSINDDLNQINVDIKREFKVFRI